MASPGHPNAVFRFDASPEIGGGHAVRSLALADTLADAGWRCTLVTNIAAPEVVPSMPHSGHAHEVVNAHDDEITALRALDRPELLIIDHYRRDQHFETAMRGWAERIAVFEDVPDRTHDCDVLIDPTPGRTQESYEALVPEACVFALGSTHAILRRQFRDARPAALARRGGSEINRILISIGSVDADGLSGPALKIVHDRLPDATIDVVLGASAPHLGTVRNQAEKLPDHVRIHVDVDDMASLMSAADLAIGAAGSSAFERCALGLPAIAITVVENQRNIAAALAKANAARVISLDDATRSDAVAQTFDELVSDHALRAGMAQAAAALCDADGARRTMLALLAPACANDNRPVTLRLADLDDEALLLNWQHHPDTRRHARDPALPKPAAHHDWLVSRLADPDCLLGIIECDETPAGMLRLDRHLGGTEISILTDPGYKRLGIARAALDLARRALPADTLIAEALLENNASHALFRSAGYHQETNTMYRLKPTV